MVGVRATHRCFCWFLCFFVGFGRVDGKKPGDYSSTTEVDQQTISQVKLRWNKLIIISQVPVSMRKTKPAETNNGQNRDEQNKQFVGKENRGQRTRKKKALPEYFIYFIFL